MKLHETVIFIFYFWSRPNDELMCVRLRTSASLAHASGLFCLPARAPVVWDASDRYLLLQLPVVFSLFLQEHRRTNVVAT